MFLKISLLTFWPIALFLLFKFSPMAFFLSFKLLPSAFFFSFKFCAPLSKRPLKPRFFVGAADSASSALLSVFESRAIAASSASIRWQRSSISWTGSSFSLFKIATVSTITSIPSNCLNFRDIAPAVWEFRRKARL